MSFFAELAIVGGLLGLVIAIRVVIEVLASRNRSNAASPSQMSLVRFAGGNAMFVAALLGAVLALVAFTFVLLTHHPG